MFIFSQSIQKIVLMCSENIWATVIVLSKQVFCCIFLLFSHNITKTMLIKMMYTLFFKPVNSEKLHFFLN